MLDNKDVIYATVTVYDAIYVLDRTLLVSTGVLYPPGIFWVEQCFLTHVNHIVGNTTIEMFLSLSSWVIILPIISSVAYSVECSGRKPY